MRRLTLNYTAGFEQMWCNEEARILTKIFQKGFVPTDWKKLKVLRENEIKLLKENFVVVRGGVLYETMDISKLLDDYITAAELRAGPRKELAEPSKKWIEFFEALKTFFLEEKKNFQELYDAVRLC